MYSVEMVFGVVLKGWERGTFDQFCDDCSGLNADELMYMLKVICRICWLV